MCPLSGASCCDFLPRVDSPVPASLLSAQLLCQSGARLLLHPPGGAASWTPEPSCAAVLAAPLLHKFISVSRKQQGGAGERRLLNVRSSARDAFDSDTSETFPLAVSSRAVVPNRRDHASSYKGEVQTSRGADRLLSGRYRPLGHLLPGGRHRNDN